MNTPKCEIIRGDVSSRKMYIGGMSYFSSGRFSRGFQVGASCAEAVVSPQSKSRKVRRLRFKILIGRQIVRYIVGSCLINPEGGLRAGRLQRSASINVDWSRAALGPRRWARSFELHFHFLIGVAKSVVVLARSQSKDSLSPFRDERQDCEGNRIRNMKSVKK